MKAANIFKINCREAIKISGSTINLLQSTEKLKDFLYSFSPSMTGELWSDAMISIISKFAKEHERVLTDYIDNKIELYSFIRSFILFLKTSKSYETIIGKTKTTNSICHQQSTTRNYLSLLHENIYDHLNNIPRSDEIKILGFGLGDGSYENELKSYLINSDKIKAALIFGYDPYSVDCKDYIPLTKDDLLNAKVSEFDLIIARWTLHHVSLNERWDEFISALNLIKTGGQLLIIEHGFIANSDDLGNDKLYLILNGIMDVIGNLIFNTEWFFKTNCEENYFLEFIKEKDIKIITDAFTENLHIDINTFGPVFPFCTVITITK